MSGEDASGPTGRLILQNPALVARILASAANPGEPMTAREFSDWLDALARTPVPSSGRVADCGAAGT